MQVHDKKVKMQMPVLVQEDCPAGIPYLDVRGLFHLLRVLHAEADMGDLVALVALAELLLHHGDAGHQRLV